MAILMKSTPILSRKAPINPVASEYADAVKTARAYLEVLGVLDKDVKRESGAGIWTVIGATMAGRPIEMSHDPPRGRSRQVSTEISVQSR